MRKNKRMGVQGPGERSKDIFMLQNTIQSKYLLVTGSFLLFSHSFVNVWFSYLHFWKCPRSSRWFSMFCLLSFHPPSSFCEKKWPTFVTSWFSCTQKRNLETWCQKRHLTGYPTLKPTWRVDMRSRDLRSPTLSTLSWGTCTCKLGERIHPCPPSFTTSHR